mgnify:CR=1 FL=1
MRRTRWTTKKKEIKLMSNEELIKFYKNASLDMKDMATVNVINFLKWCREELDKRKIKY